MNTNTNIAYNYNDSQNKKVVSFTALPKKYQVVDEYLIRGPHPGVRDVFKLKKDGVNQIYDFRHISKFRMKFIERFVCKLAGIEYHRKPYSFLEHKLPTLRDYEFMAKSVKENGEKGGKTLFHCNSGTHRTALMTAFYDITKGKPLNECMESNPNYSDDVEKSLQKHVYNFNYFSRNRVDTTTMNPAKRAMNIFNNKVEKATKFAFSLFVDMMTPKTKKL